MAGRFERTNEMPKDIQQIISKLEMFIRFLALIQKKRPQILICFMINTCHLTQENFKRMTQSP